MATHLRTNTAIDTAVEIVDAIAAGLEGDPETSSLAATWNALVARGDTIAHDLRGQRRVARRARVVVAVADAGWDSVVKAFTRYILDEVKGKRDQPLYQRFFRQATSTEITRYGIDKEVDVGRGILAELGGPTTPLGSRWTSQLTPVTDALEAASAARKTAVMALGPLSSQQFLYVEDVNLEIDRLEGQLQTIFAGDPARVAAYLSALRRDDSVTSPVPDPTPTP